MADTDLAFASALKLRQLIATKQVSPVEVTELFLSRIDRLDPQLNAYLTVTADQAVSSARAAERAVQRGDDLAALHGVPVAIKDLEMTAGVRTTGGSLLYQDRVPEIDSAVVERIKGAGAVVLGKTNTPEFGLLGHTENRLGDHCRNPWNTDRTTGGSSGGAGAALAAGLCTLATGSDGGGSIRIPASFCGVYGIKPTLGRVPRYSGTAAPIVANQTSQAGPMSRTVRDSALFLQVLAGHDARDVGSLRDTPDDYLAACDAGVDGLTVGWSRDLGYAVVDGEVSDSAARAARVFEELGCSVDDPGLDLHSPFDAFWTLFTTNVRAMQGDLLKENADRMTRYARESFEAADGFTGVDYALAVGQVDRLKAAMDDLFERYDLLLTPTMAVTAFPVGEPPTVIAGTKVDRFWGFIPFTFPINMIGHPAASIPCGFSSEGLPIGLHIIGRRGAEATVIAASAAFEEARPWVDMRPPVA